MLPPAQFEPTRWSLVLRARGADAEARRRALGEMCEAYWYPLYAYLRRSGHPQHDAEDLAQEFFVRLMDGRLLGAADPARGKFRTLLRLPLPVPLTSPTTSPSSSPSQAVPLIWRSMNGSYTTAQQQARV